ncbi:MAG: thiamine pyrophosphate-dependent enzyme [Alphaproteobacteria bacterium]|nr:thiamine pyrophosphate-dependent enzyme [Alphaproteobacteria bacterium]MDX5369901.1 thiamine pyrophosphate-dependent enzyme [Alphaproteobacteria bacterium]MDX5464497.1 thiamine pyrophosphate-dependent enzyme [Alphaproteobacteria bacterium]
MASTAAARLVEALRAHGVDRVFCVPGESYLALLDALHDASDIDVVVTRHESGAGFMALADAKLTGRPGVAAVSRGPGATNASIAVHLAEQDAAPLVLLVGQVARHERGRGAFQEVDYGKTFADMAKGVWEVHDAERLPEVVARAFHVAMSGTPGPVLIVLPEDMLEDTCAADVVPPLPVAAGGPSQEDVARVADLLEKAERPLIIAGGALDSERGRAALARAAAHHGVPVALSFKRQEIFDNASPLYAGYLGFKIPKPLVDTLSEADLILAIGTRLTDTATQGYTLPSAPVPRQPLVHVYPDAGQIGRVFRTDVGLAADPAALLEALASLNATRAGDRTAWAEKTHAAALGAAFAPRDLPNGVDFGRVVQALRAKADRDATIITDSGNFSSWVHKLWGWDGTTRAIGSVGGAMGLAMPGAVAAALRDPGRQALTFIGDGGALMTGNELATACARNLPVKVFILNNGTYGTIRLHQEKAYPGRVVGTDLVNPDFAAWARAFGAEGLTVATPSDVEGVVAQALAAKGPVVVDVKSDAELLSAFATVSGVRAAAGG